MDDDLYHHDDHDQVTDEPLIPLASEDSDLGDGGDFESFSGNFSATFLQLFRHFFAIFGAFLFFSFSSDGISKCYDVLLYRRLDFHPRYMHTLYTELFVVIIENIAGTEEEEEDLASISANSK